MKELVIGVFLLVITLIFNYLSKFIPSFMWFHDNFIILLLISFFLIVFTFIRDILISAFLGGVIVFILRYLYKI